MPTDLPALDEKGLAARQHRARELLVSLSDDREPDSQADVDKIVAAFEDEVDAFAASAIRAPQGVERFNEIIDAVEARCLAADGPVTPTLAEMREDELAELWRCVQRIRFALAPAPSSGEAEPFDAQRIAEVVEEAGLDGAACGWRSCSGCHETNEGAETGFYPYSKAFGCHVGSGCSECGGIGVVWHHYDASGLEEMARDPDHPSPSGVNAEVVAALAQEEARGLAERAGIDMLDDHDLFLADLAETLVKFAALQAQAAASGAGEWRSMDSAPKDGREFIAIEAGDVYKCKWHEYDDGEGRFSEGWWDLINDSFENPTGWIPLPAASAPTEPTEGR